jgi:hypothetical protein
MDLQISWRIGVAVGAPPDFPLSPRHLAAFCSFAGLRSGASSGNVKAVFFSDFGCFGFLASRLDRLCPFAMTSFPCVDHSKLGDGSRPLSKPTLAPARELTLLSRE